MIIVTGGAGFIGSNIVKAFNDRGRKDILIVDHLGKGMKFKNLLGLEFDQMQSKEDFFAALDNKEEAEQLLDFNIQAVIHMGACSDTMEYDGDYMWQNNYEFSLALLDFCVFNNIPLIYASSASTYGLGKKGFREEPECEEALNLYAFSKLMFDRKVREYFKDNFFTDIIGLRFFNVYGPQESHKGKMASIFYQMYNQLKSTGKIKLFKGTDGVADGEQRRDFIYVNDVVKICLLFFDHCKDRACNGALNGIYNCGTGLAHSYNEVAHAVIKAVGHGEIEYIDFPDVLRGKYQNYTQADVSSLNIVKGYDGVFTDLDEAVKDYVSMLDKNGGYYCN